MGLARRTLAQSLLLGFMAFAVITCSSKKDESKPVDEGGQGTGGGVVFYSTQDEVKATLDQAIKLATEPDQTRNIFVQFWADWGRRTTREYIKNPSRVFPNLSPLPDATLENIDLNSFNFESPPLQAFSRNKIVLLETGDCLKSDKLLHTDASVSAFSLDAEICFSLENLMRVPPSSLLREILSLVLHEATHLGGAEEEEAIGWQQEFSNYFGARFGDLEINKVQLDTLNTLAEARILLSRAQGFANENPADPRIFAFVGRLSETLDSLPYYLDPLALELKTRPVHPELIPNYSSSVFSLIQKIKILFEIRSDNLTINGGMTIHLQFMSEEDVVPRLSEIALDIAQIEENFLSFIGSSEEAVSVCLPPQGVGDLNIFPIDPPDNSPNGVRTCAPQY